LKIICVFTHVIFDALGGACGLRPTFFAYLLT